MRISLVLGSGGARGYAHIGVIQELEERGHEIVAIAGASMGALVGGAYAAGRLPEFTQAARHLTRAEVLFMMRPRLGRPGLIKGESIMSLFSRLIGEVRIEDLPIPYTAVATDLMARREIWFHEGPLLAAIRASIAIPTVFTPVMMHGRLLVDGGLVNPLPMESSMRFDADLTVAVSLFGKEWGLSRQSATSETSDAQTELIEAVTPPAGTLARLSERLTETLVRTRHAPHEELFEPLPDDLDLTSMMMMSLDVMQARIEASRVSQNPPDVHIEVPTSTANVLDMWEAERIIDLGRQLAVEKFDRLGL